MNTGLPGLYRQLFEQTPSVQLLVDPASGMILHANHAATRFYGAEENLLQRLRLSDLMADPPADVQAPFGELLAGSRTRIAVPHRVSGGGRRDIEIEAGLVTLDNGTGVLHVIARDISHHVHADAALRGYQELFNEVPIPFYRAKPGPRGVFLRVNPAFVRLFEAESEEELFGYEIASLYIDPADRSRFSDTLMEHGEIYRYELRLRTVKGRMIWAADTAYRHLDESGDPVFDGVLEDITRQRELEDELSYQARHDKLTDLANRRQCEGVLLDEIERSERYGQALSALMIDVDSFKRINDEHGHAAGDRVLRRIARTLRERVRQTDLPARWGGEEFMVLLPATPVTRARQLAEGLRLAVEELRQEDPIPVVTISVGYADYGHSEGTARFLQRLDRALYCAKEEGRNRSVEAETPPELQNQGKGNNK